MTEPRCNFRPGQKVVCIDDFANLRWPQFGKAGLSKGEVYAIRAVTLFYNGYPEVLLEELRDTCGMYPDGAERGFMPSRFERVYDISVFHEICANVGKPVVEVFFEEIRIS